MGVTSAASCAHQLRLLGVMKRSFQHTGSRKLVPKVAATLALLSLTLVPGGGCVSQSEGEALRRDLRQVKRDLAQERARASVARERLKEVMEKATALSTRTSADVSVQVERLQLDVSKLSGQFEAMARDVETLKTKIAEQETALAKTTPATPSADTSTAAAPTDPNALFKQGNEKIAASDHEEGRRLLRHFIARYPSDRRVARAQLALGNSYYAQQKLAPAIQEYRKVIERHGTSPVLPEALYKIGMSFYQLKYCSDAKSFFLELTRNHKTSKFAPKAQEVLKRIRRYRRNRRICTS